jgi:uncharacterized protein YlaI
MEPSETPSPECSAIDEDTIELHVMGRLEEGPVREHLDNCESCKLRVAKHRAWIEDLKRGLLKFPHAKKTIGGKGE